MGFTKRRKQWGLYRGSNPDPTAEELHSGVGTHVGRDAHPNPDPTPEQVHHANSGAQKADGPRVAKPRKKR